MRVDCTHPPYTATADGAVGGISAWCSYCGSAKLNGVWTHPQYPRSGKNAHADHGGGPLPTLDQYVKAGYKAENYDHFMTRRMSPLSEDEG